MKNSILLIVTFCLCSCLQNRVDEPGIQDPFVEKTLAIFEELSEYYPPKDIVMLLSEVDTEGYQTVTFRLRGETKKAIELGSFVERRVTNQRDGTTCHNRFECGREIKECLDNGVNVVISNGAFEDSAWCVTCIEPS